MKHIQSQTMQIIYSILSSHKGIFSQRGLWKRCENRVSIGQINSVVRDLQQKGYVERKWKNSHRKALEQAGLMGEDTTDYETGRASYVLADPIGLLRFVSLFRSMSQLKAFPSVQVSAPFEKVIDELGKRGAVFCLGTAMEKYSSYYRAEEISFYCFKHEVESYRKYILSARHGNTRISCYFIDYIRAQKELNKDLLNELIAPFLDDTVENVRYTSLVQTVIDMFCDGKGVYTKPLLKKLWGVEV